MELLIERQERAFLSVKTARAKILLIEGKRADHPSFAFGLDKKGYQVDSVASGTAALVHLTSSRPDLVIVDAASMRTSGRRICQSLQKSSQNLPIVLVVEQNSDLKEKTGADVVLLLPFTLQKLVNRIRPLLPVDQKDLLQVGPFQLDTVQRVARCQGKQSRLTPRLVTLLKILMENPGTVIEREHLFRQVWDTAYTGDTRTLDVHVSWLRQALEADPRHPKFIKTIRGQGYRLDLEEVQNANGFEDESD
jgi:DNA-binding response OmpR family regulator